MDLTRCGDPECPERPVIDEPSGTAYKDRIACPVCGSKIRAFSRAVFDSISALGGSTSRGAAEAIVLRASSTLTVQAEVRTAKPLTLLGLPADHVVVVRFIELGDGPDPACLIEVTDSSGGLVASGAGETPGDALSAMFERMLPGSSTERVADAEEDPLPDDL